MGVDPAFWSGRRVLVTGHTGFKGSWLSLWLAQLGADVIGVSDRVYASPNLYEIGEVAADIDAQIADVRDRDAIARIVAQAKPDVVLHLAAQPFVRLSYEQPVQTYATNVMGTVHVLDAIRLAGCVRAVVVVTSDKCYDNNQSRPPRAFVEDDPMGGHDPYSNSKGCAELVTDAYRRSFFGDPDGTRVGSGRAGNVIGGGDWGVDRLIPDIVRGALAREEIVIRRPDAIRPWQHVLNPLSGYLMLAQALHGGEPVAEGMNFGPAPDDVQTVRQIVERLETRWPEPLDWRIEAEGGVHEAGYLSLDSSRAAQRLGWAPAWDLDQALDAIVDWSIAYRDGADVRGTTLAQIATFAEAVG